jgi:hypothetical protein
MFMNKKILSALAALILLVPVSANAASLRNKTVAQPTIAILDTAIDTSIPLIKDRIIFEACVTQWSTCPNGLGEMEGKNSATLPVEFISKNGFDHGTQMASLAIAANPNINIVFVRIIGINSKGLRQASGEQTVYNALDWVLRNKDRFNIQAVSLSQSHHSLGAVGTDYCPKTPITEGKIKSLADSGIPLFVSAGNNSDYSRIDWPACISSAISIGATMPTKTVAPYTNFDPVLLDFFAQGTTQAITIGGNKIPVAGTSASTVIAATQWATIKASKPTLTYSEMYDLISRTSLPTSNSKVKNGKLINLEAALNG